MRHLLLFMFMHVAITGYGQTWAPAGAKWTYNFTETQVSGPHVNVNSFPVHLSVIKDTLLAGKTASVIEGTFFCATATRTYTYSENNIVYFYNAAQSRYKTFIDFNKNTGDQFYLTIPMNIDQFGNDSILLKVDSVRYLNINLQQQKSLYLSQVSPGNWVFSGWVTEQIGPSNYFYPVYGACDPPAHGLRCYEDDNFPVYHHGYPNCDTTYSYFVGIADDVKQPLLITSSSSMISFYAHASSSFYISTLTGANVRTGSTLQGKVEISTIDLATGVYILTVISSEETVTQKFGVIH